MESSKDMDPQANTIESLARYRTADSVYIPKEVFEKIYLNPQTPVKGNLRKIFGNPTPLALVGFLISTAPVACQLMGWRGSGGGGAAVVGPLYFFGGMLQIIGSVLEWIIGNTFPFVVFGTYGAVTLSLAATLQPSYNAQGAFLSDATTATEKSAGNAEFLASYAFFLLFMGIVTTIFLVCALRTNAVFMMVFVTLATGWYTLAASYWARAQGDADRGQRLEVATGATFFVVCMFAFYLLISILLQAVDFPRGLPVGDLSTKIRGGTQLQKSRAAESKV